MFIIYSTVSAWEPVKSSGEIIGILLRTCKSFWDIKMFIIYFTISVQQQVKSFLVKQLRRDISGEIGGVHRIHVSHSDILWIVYNLFHYFSGRNSKQVSGEINGVLHRDISGEIDAVLPCTCKSLWNFYNVFQYFSASTNESFLVKSMEYSELFMYGFTQKNSNACHDSTIIHNHFKIIRIHKKFVNLSSPANRIAVPCV